MLASAEVSGTRAAGWSDRARWQVTVPPIFRRARRTTSRPSPRPEIWVIRDGRHAGLKQLRSTCSLSVLAVAASQKPGSTRTGARQRHQCQRRHRGSRLLTLTAELSLQPNRALRRFGRLRGAHRAA